MIFSTRSEYGVMMLAHLARHYGQGPLSLTVIATDLGLSLEYLEQIVPALRSHGIIESQRGAKGGYILAQSPEKIRMGPVIRALEERDRKNGKGSLSVMPCANLDGSTDSCDHEKVCSGPVLWVRVRDAITQALDATTLADLVPDTRRKLPLLLSSLPGSMMAGNQTEPIQVGAATNEA